MKYVLAIAGSLVVLGAAACAVAGAFLLTLVDDDGWLQSGQAPLATPGIAVVVPAALIQANSPDGAGPFDDLGNRDIRVRAEATNGKQVFVGVARASDLDAYLGTSRLDVASAVRFDPWHFEARPAGSETVPVAPPATRRFWLASASGAGERQLAWAVEDGDFRFVVMNADGSPGIVTNAGLGVRFPYLRPFGWAGLGIGAFFALAGVALVVFALRRSSDVAAHRGPGPRAPVAAP